MNIIQLKDRNDYIKFDNKNNLGQWFSYTTDYPEKNALHLIWFDYGIYAGIEHFNTDESGKLPKHRCLNKRMYNKWIIEVVVRQKEGPHKNVVPFNESLCDSMEAATAVATKYISIHQEAARAAQIEHMNIFKTNSLT